MGSVTAIDEVDRIRRELAEYDLAHSSCPVDRRRAEKEAEARAQEAQTAQEQKNTANWAAWVDHRIMQYLDYYCLHLFEHDNKDKPTIMNAAIGGMFGSERKDRHKELKAAIEAERQSVDAKLAALEERLKSVAGKLPVVKTWQPETVVYQAELISHRGSLWQAKRDTAQSPGGADWICVAGAGRDAITPIVRGLFDTHEAYAQLDVVECEGASYIAKRDNPGIPGHDDGWQVFGLERMDLRAEVKAAIEDVRQSFDAKLAALEQASSDRWAVFDQRIVEHIERARESVLQGTTEVVERFRDELKEFKRALEEKERAFDAKLAALEQAWKDRWAVIDQRIDQSIERAREPLLQGTNEVLGHFRDELREFRRGLDQNERAFEAKLAALEECLKSVPGKLPVVKSSWQSESVIYEPEMVCHNGSLYQARKDTAQAPGGSDWVCVARHGRDAITPSICGDYDAHEAYAELDIVSYDGTSYIARRDNPGLPGHGDGWQVLSQRGKQGHRGEAIRGPQGEKGAKGDKGDDAHEIVDWHIDPVNYRVVPFSSNGKAGKELDLRPLFLQFLQEVGTIDYAWSP